MWTAPGLALESRGRRRLFLAGLFCARTDAGCGAAVKGVPAMCDFSLHLVASRPAKVGDKLVTTQFNNSITRGFAAVDEPNVAVCLLPGTEIAFDNPVEWRATVLGFFERKQLLGERVA